MADLVPPDSATAGLAPPAVQRRHWWIHLVLLTIALGLASLLTFWRLGDRSLLGDEGTNAVPARLAAVHGQWYPLRWNTGEVFVDKPPLNTLLVAVSFSIFGVTEFADRLPTALAAVATVGALYLLAAWPLGPGWGFLAAMIFATSRVWLFVHGARDGVVDPLLTLLVLLCLVAYFRFRETGERSWLLVACTLSVLTAGVKGLIGPTFVGFILLAWELSIRRRPWSQRLLGPAALIGAGFAAYGIWLLDAARFGLDGRAFLARDILRRATSGIDPGHLHGALYYCRILGDAFGHWWIFLVPAAFAAGVALRSAHRDLWCLVAVWPAVVLVVLELSASKLPWYPDAALPAIAILLAAGCAVVVRFLGRWPRLVPLSVLVLAGLLGARAWWAWDLARRPPYRGQLSRLLLVLRGAPSAKLYVDQREYAFPKVRGWNTFYLDQLEGWTEVITPALTHPTGCVVVFTAFPADRVRQLGAPPVASLPLARRDTREAPLILLDYCGGVVARRFG